MNPAISSVIVFFVSAAVDAVWAKYIATAAQGRAFAAAIWSSVIVGCGSFVTLEYVFNKWMIIPAVIGGFVGTYAMIKYDNK